MKKLLLLSALAISGLAFSQKNVSMMRLKDHKEVKVERMKDIKDKMAKELGLSEIQLKKISEIDDKYKSREDELKSQSEKLREQNHELRIQKKSEIEKVLTPAQVEKLSVLKEKYHKGKMCDGMKKEK